jgi:hypothetical protein
MANVCWRDVPRAGLHSALWGMFSVALVVHFLLVERQEP